MCMIYREWDWQRNAREVRRKNDDEKYVYLVEHLYCNCWQIMSGLRLLLLFLWPFLLFNAPNSSCFVCPRLKTHTNKISIPTLHVTHAKLHKIHRYIELQQPLLRAFCCAVLEQLLHIIEPIEPWSLEKWAMTSLQWTPLYWRGRSCS